MSKNLVERFLSRIVPDGSVIYLGWPAGTEDRPYFKHTTHRTPADAANAAVNRGLENLYFGVAGYASERVQNPKTGRLVPRRAADNVQAVKVLMFDIDANGRNYDDKRAAMSAFVAFLGATGMPKPTDVVDSGGGFHIYWVLDRALTVDEWRPLASALKAAASEKGLRIDPAVTADAARVMRPPASYNPKWGKAAKWLIQSDRTIEVDTVRSVLRPYMMASVSGGASDIGRASSVFAAGDESADEFGVLGRPMYFAQIATRCGVMQDALETGGRDHSEPLWFNIMSVLARTADGDEYVHKVSNKHPKYSKEETQKKYEHAKQSQLENTSVGPARCDTFSQYHSACQTCPFRRTVKTPFALGGEEVGAPYPAGYKIDSKGLLYQLEADENTGSTVWRVICTYPLRDFAVYVDDVEGWVLTFSAQVGDGKYDVHIPTEKLADHMKFNAYMAKNGVMLGANTNDVRKFMISFVEMLQQTHKRVDNARPWGWNDDGFAVGGQLYLPGGQTRPAPARADEGLMRVYGEQGVFDGWKDVADRLAEQDHAPLTAILATAFAAPLLRWVAQHGTIVSATSQESGRGKSTALKIAAAVWGDPVRSVASLGDTSNMFARKMGQLGSLPAYWDELRHVKDMEAFAQLAFRVGQGKDKGRLTRTMHLDVGRTWDTMMCVASNGSLIDHMVRQGGGEAGFYRVFEWYVEPPRERLHAVDLDVEANYGHAGRVYARWLVEHQERAKEAVRRLNRKLTDELQQEQAERFWIASMTALIAGAHFARYADIVDINVETLQSFLTDQLKYMRSRLRSAVSQSVDPEEILADYIRSISHRTVHTREMRPRNYKGRWSTTHYGDELLPRGEIVAEIGHEPPTMRLAAKPFNSYLTTLGESATHTIRRLQASGVLSDAHHAVLGAGSHMSTNYRTLCYDVLKYDPES